MQQRSGSAGPTEPTPHAGDLAAAFCAALVDEWSTLGLTHAVLCPGSRNTPISVALAADRSIEVQVVHDERSASFIALGLAMSTGRPALLTCTSGSAPAHFHPAVLEADLAAVPMLVLTADRPPELQGVLAPQTTNQRELYGGAVRWFCEPGPPAEGSDPWWRDLARDALTRATGDVPGPVHLNLAFREPLLGDPTTVREQDPSAVAKPLPATGMRLGWNLPDEDVARLRATITGRRGVVVAGARTAANDVERSAVLAFADQLGWPVLADAPSGVRVPSAQVVGSFDAIVRSGSFDDHFPEVVLRLGGLVTSKALAGWLARSDAAQFGIDRYGMCPDPDAVLAGTFNVVPSDALDALRAARPEPAPGAWSERWKLADRLSSDAITVELAPSGQGIPTEPAVARDVLAAMPAEGQLLVASSMPVRDLEGFAAPRWGVTVHSNRGTNGIDGAIATARGIAFGAGSPTVLLCGDLAFLHDIGSLSGIGGRGADLTIVVVDNNGGGIFHFLAQHEQLDAQTFEQLYGTPHGLDLVEVSRGFGVSAERVTSQVGLSAALAGARTRRGVQVLVTASDRARNVEVHRSLGDAVNLALAAL